MKSFYFRIFLIAILITVTLSCQSSNVNPDLKTIEELATIYPDQVNIIFENNYVIALEYNIMPGVKLPLHNLGNRAIYALNDSEIKFNIDNTKDVKISADGDTYWQAAGMLAPENVGQAEAHLLVVTRTEAILPEYAQKDLEQDVSQTAPEIANLLLDNDYIRVIEVNLEPGQEIKTHRGIARVVYSLEPYTIDYITEEANGTGQKTFEAGFTHWHQAGSHSLVNIGETTMHDLIFEFKK